MRLLLNIFPWLNKFDRSHVSATTQFIIGRLRDPLLGETWEEDYKRLDAISRAGVNQLEDAEVGMICADELIKRGRWKEALDHLEKSVKLYRSINNQTNRLAVALWIRGIVKYELLLHHEAVDSWNEACKLYKSLGRFDKGEDVGIEEVLWFRNCYTDLITELITIPEGVVAWIDELDSIKLPISVNYLMGKIDELVRKQSFTKIYPLIERHELIADRDYSFPERGMLFVCFGMAFYQMDNVNKAIDYWHKALGCFLNPSLHHVVVKWMLGSVVYDIPEKRTQAVSYWKESIDEIDKLFNQTSSMGNVKKYEWYKERIKYLKIAEEKRKL
jgi:tetratricopeptide (TPR) repeat protein